MALSLDEVRRIAHLARIEITPSEAADVRAKLESIFELIGRMRAVDTTGIAPLYTPLSAVQDVPLRLRDDAVTEGNVREAAQRSAPVVEDGLFLVPRVIE